MSANLTLYELAEERNALDDLLALDEGEWTDAAESLANDLTAQLVRKADGFGSYIRDLEANADAIKAEETRLAARRKALESRVDWLKRSGLMALDRMGETKVAGTLFTLAVQKNPPSVDVPASLEGLPAEYVRVVPESRVADKTAIAKALKAGADVPGCALRESYSLRIR